MTRVQAVTRRVHERGVEWLNAPGVRIGDGVLRVRWMIPATVPFVLDAAQDRIIFASMPLGRVAGLPDMDIRMDAPKPSPVSNFMRALFGSRSYLWIALVFAVTLLK